VKQAMRECRLSAESLRSEINARSRCILLASASISSPKWRNRFYLDQMPNRILERLIARSHLPTPVLLESLTLNPPACHFCASSVHCQNRCGGKLRGFRSQPSFNAWQEPLGFWLAPNSMDFLTQPLELCHSCGGRETAFQEGR